jgi:fructose-1,6-bisphosphatase/sedoheptulose 1,7-bisphosphatase-like protein
MLGNDLEVLQVQNGCKKLEMHTLSRPKHQVIPNAISRAVNCFTLAKVGLSQRGGCAGASGVASATEDSGVEDVHRASCTPEGVVQHLAKGFLRGDQRELVRVRGRY